MCAGLKWVAFGRRASAFNNSQTDFHRGCRLSGIAQFKRQVAGSHAQGVSLPTSLWILSLWIFRGDVQYLWRFVVLTRVVCVKVLSLFPIDTRSPTKSGRHMKVYRPSYFSRIDCVQSMIALLVELLLDRFLRRPSAHRAPQPVGAFRAWSTWSRS